MASTHIENWLEAAGSGDLDLLMALLHGNPYTSIDGGDRCGSSALHYAAEKGHLEIVKFLVSKGAVVNITNMWEKTPLHSACNNGHLEVVEFLVEHGARIEATSNKKRFTPLHLASQYNHLSIAQYLVLNGADATAQAEDGKIPLEVATSEEMKALLRQASSPLNVRDRQGRERRNSEAVDADIEQQQRDLAYAAAEYDRKLREEAEGQAEVERKTRELEEMNEEEEKRKREKDEKSAEEERLRREEAENVWALELEQRQKEEAILKHEKRLFDAANAAAESEFFTQRVLADDFEKHRKQREKEFVESEIERIAKEAAYAEAERCHIQRLLDEAAAEEERKVRESAAADAQIRHAVREQEALEAQREAEKRIIEAAEAEEKRIKWGQEEAAAELETMERELEETECRQREEAALQMAIERGNRKRAESLSGDCHVPSDWVPMRWQTEAAEQKQREEDEINRVIAAEAKARLIQVIMNPDDYYGCYLPNVPYGVVGDVKESQSYSALSALALDTDNADDQLEMSREEAQRKFRHVAIKRMVLKIADIACDENQTPETTVCLLTCSTGSVCVPCDNNSTKLNSPVQNSINLLHSFKHPNIIRLLGYSVIPETQQQIFERSINPTPLVLREGDARDCLIYEIAAKGSVDKNLLDDRLARKMTWRHRVRIAAAIACALNYLHCRTPGTPAFHKNIQSAKVVLTAGWCPKLVDVGLIKDFSEDHPVSRSGVRFGTPAYMCPQYNRTGRYEEKSETAAAESGLPLEERISDIKVDERVGTWPQECAESFRALAMDCLSPYSRRISNIADVMKRLRALETVFCPRSEDILCEKPEELDVEKYKAMMISLRDSAALEDRRGDVLPLSLSEKVKEKEKEKENVLQCGICALKMRLCDGVKCPGAGAHFMCSECFDGVNLRHQLAVENAASFASHDCRLVCELCVPAGEVSKVTDETAAQHLSVTGFVRYLSARKQ